MINKNKFFKLTKRRMELSQKNKNKMSKWNQNKIQLIWVKIKIK